MTYRQASVVRRRPGIRCAPTRACHDSSTAAAAPAAASREQDEGRCASSRSRVRWRCVWRFLRCRSPGNANRHGPVWNSSGWCRTPTRAFSTSATRSPRAAASNAIPAPVIPPPITTTSNGSPSASAVRSAARRVALRAVGSGITTDIRSARGQVRWPALPHQASSGRSAPTEWSTVRSATPWWPCGRGHRNGRYRCASDSQPGGKGVDQHASAGSQAFGDVDRRELHAAPT